MRRQNHLWSSPLLSFATLLVLLSGLAVTGPATADDQGYSGYGYYRTVEGPVRLTSGDEAEPIEIEQNYPVLTGDRVWVAIGSRLEMQLPSRDLVRVGGGTDLFVEELALAAEAADEDVTVLRLLEGEIPIQPPRPAAHHRATRRRDGERLDLPAVHRLLQGTQRGRGLDRDRRARGVRRGDHRLWIDRRSRRGASGDRREPQPAHLGRRG